MTENCDFERSVCLTVVLLPNGDIVLPMKDNKYTCFPKGLLNCAIASYKKLTDNLFGETELIVDEPNYKTMMLRAINNAAQPYIVDVSSGFLKYDSYEIADIGELRSTIYSRIFDEDNVQLLPVTRKEKPLVGKYFREQNVKKFRLRESDGNRTLLEKVEFRYLVLMDLNCFKSLCRLSLKQFDKLTEEMCTQDLQNLRIMLKKSKLGDIVKGIKSEYEKTHPKQVSSSAQENLQI